MIRTYIGLGSNLSDPVLQIQTTFVQLDTIAKSKLIKKSRLYRSPALIAPDHPEEFSAPDFINAVAAFDTDLSAHELMDKLIQIEKAHGRNIKTSHWAPRTLDLDLLLYGQMIINTPKLLVPHPELAKRNFVLYPLAEIAPDLVLPDGSSILELLATCPKRNLSIIARD